YPVTTVAYTADVTTNLLGPPGPQFSNNDYSDGGLARAQGEAHAHIDEETLRLIESEHLLVDRECLVLADEIGKGNW
ncbi:unnamed protein product, partial [Lymnaea stagnalis]